MKNQFKLFVLFAISTLALRGEDSEKTNIKALELLCQDVKKIDASKPFNLNKISNEAKKVIENLDFSPHDGVDKEIDSAVTFTLTLLSLISQEKGASAREDFAILAEFYKAVLSKIDAQYEENYQWQPVTANVAPPLGAPASEAGYASGMDPAAIKDEKYRQKYLDAIAANQAKNLKNGQQSRLKMGREMLISFLSFIKTWKNKPELSNAQVTELFTQEGKSREILRVKLSENDKKIDPSATRIP